MKKLLFVFPIVALLAAGCNSSQQAYNQTPAAQNTNPTPAPTPSSTTTLKQGSAYLIIKEWGVEFEKPNGMDDLQYVIYNPENKAFTSSAKFTTQQLIDLNKTIGGKCTNYSSIGFMGRHTAQELNDLKNDKYGPGVPDNVKVGNYYYSFTTPQEACSFNEQFKGLEVSQTSALQAMVLKSLKVVQ